MKLKLIFCIIFTCATSFHLVVCKDVIVDGVKYFISYPEKKSWYHALAHCLSIGQDFVNIRNAVENRKIIEIISRTENRRDNDDSSYWMGGTDLGSEGNFYWITTGKRLTYSNWTEQPYQQPDNWMDIENCMAFSEDYNYGWNDQDCLGLLHFICRDRGSSFFCEDEGCQNLDVKYTANSIEGGKSFKIQLIIPIP